MKSNADRNNNPPRRNFLLGATLGTAGAIAVAVSGKTSRQADGPAAETESKPEGYRETAHILQYYDTARM